MELLISDLAVPSHLPNVLDANTACVVGKAWFAETPGFNAYDTAKWAQRLERAIHGDRVALDQLDKAGFALTVL